MTKSKRRVYHQKYYKKNKARYLETARARQAKNREFYRNLKSVRCVDCKRKYPPICMDFHHRDKKSKVNEVSNLTKYSIKKILEEATKCDIICSNCHRLRTWK